VLDIAKAVSSVQAHRRRQTVEAATALSIQLRFYTRKGLMCIFELLYLLSQIIATADSATLSSHSSTGAIIYRRVVSEHNESEWKEMRTVESGKSVCNWERKIMLIAENGKCVSWEWKMRIAESAKMFIAAAIAATSALSTQAATGRLIYIAKSSAFMQNHLPSFKTICFYAKQSSFMQNNLPS
jgi:hypothetical protein